ncbi:MAG TPA: YdaS family helix-turn-helix protein [Rhodocyclaceae bacterium]|uniref:transcriptional regulator n=1 Tax=Plasticicumulans sp. TaxID=2307179 RepID=UPI002C43D864|nr:YdaS family helix-turn-helix protein [Rhodocyclaceae bacterium]
MNAIERAIASVGTQAALAKAVGVTQGLVWQWKVGRLKPSPLRVPAIVRACNGAVQAHELRPDLPDLFPKPAEAPTAEAAP